MHSSVQAHPVVEVDENPAQPHVEPPYRRIQLVAHGLFVGATAGILAMIVASATGHAPVGPWKAAWTIAVHALEGAFVGAVCDWFAVWKAYRAIEVNHGNVASEIGAWVGKELLGAKVVKKRLHALLQDPEVKRKVYEFVDQKVGSEPEARAFLERAWARFEPQIVDYVVAYDLSSGEVGAASRVFRDDAVVGAVMRCLGQALVETVQVPEFAAAVEAAKGQQAWHQKWLLGMIDIQGKLAAFGRRMRSEPRSVAGAGMGPAVVATLQRGAAEYVAAWNQLPELERRSAVAAVIRHLREPVIGAVARFLLGLRDELRRIDVLGDHGRSRHLVDAIENFVNDRVSTQVGEFVSNMLRARSATETRRLIEDKTRGHLEWIRINGTLLGVAVGAALGIVLHLAKVG